MFRTWMGIPLSGLHTLISQPTNVLGKAAHGVCAPDLVIMKPGLPFQLVRHSGSPLKLLFLMSTPVLVIMCASCPQSTVTSRGCLSMLAFAFVLAAEALALVGRAPMVAATTMTAATWRPVSRLPPGESAIAWLPPCSARTTRCRLVAPARHSHRASALYPGVNLRAATNEAKGDLG